MTSLLHFEDKVHRKGLARAESLPLLMPRLLSQVLEHLGTPEIQMPSGPVYGAIYGDADLFSPPAARPGGGTGS